MGKMALCLLVSYTDFIALAPSRQRNKVGVRDYLLMILSYRVGNSTSNGQGNKTLFFSRKVDEQGYSEHKNTKITTEYRGQVETKPPTRVKRNITLHLVPL